MNPRANSAASAIESTVSPFEQITRLEDEQEQRVREALEQCALEGEEAEKSAVLSAKALEEKLRQEATDELREYAKTEPAAILTKSEAETADTIKELEKTFAKKFPKMVDSIVQSIMDFTFLSHR